MKTISRFFSLIWAKIILKFGHKFDTSKIPYGPYCYTPKESPSAKNNWVYHITPCPYYKSITKRWNGCQYLGLITDDFLFDDQCKVCGEKEDYKKEEELHDFIKSQEDIPADFKKIVDDNFWNLI